MMKSTRCILALGPALLLASCDSPPSKAQDKSDSSNGRAAETTSLPTPYSPALSVEDKVYKALECAMVSDAQIARLGNVRDNDGNQITGEAVDQFRLIAEKMKSNMAIYYGGLTQNYPVNENWLQEGRDKVEAQLAQIIEEFDKEPGPEARQIADQKLHAMFDRSCKYLVENEGDELRSFLR